MLVVGDVLIDRFVEGRVSRVSPEAPVPVLKHATERALLGGAGNVAANILAYGARASLVALTGADPGAADLAELCAGFPRLKTHFVRDRSRPTTVKTRFLAGWHQLLRVDAEETHAMAEGVAGKLVARATAAVPRVGAVILSDYAKGVLDVATIKAIIAAARKAGVPVIVDPKKADAAVFAGATLLTPNLEEMAQFSGIRAEDDASAEAACRAVLDKVAIDAILVTRGAGGMTLCERGKPALHVPAETHRVFDVTGAGDTVIATIAAALSIGEAIPDAVRLANVAAGIVVTKPGTATVLPGELAQALGALRSASLVDAGEAAERIATWKAQGLRVGFTNGCFDLLHQGHLYSLGQAARRVDRLVVGINSDASTRRLKGPGRPVQDEATRAAVLAGLRFVDLVVAFNEDTPEVLITELTPNILFKGADYAEHEVVGGAHVKAHGGKVELLPLLKGHSTTNTVKRMKG